MANTEKENLFPVNNESAMNGSAKPQDTVQVFFPCVHGEASGQLVTVSCFQANELKGAIKAVSGIDDETARRIIGAARYSETDDRTATGVIALFSNPLFGGESYGLALAIADKMIRYGSRGEWTEIYATGKIPLDGCGAVEAIKEIEKKLDLILSNGKSRSLFIFPNKTLNEHSDNLKQKLVKLEENEISWIAINHLDDLDGKLWCSKINKNDFKQTGGIVNRIRSKTSVLFSKTRSSYIYTIAGILCFLGLVAILLALKYFILSVPKTDQAARSVLQKPLTIKQDPDEEGIASRNKMQLNSENDQTTNDQASPKPRANDIKKGIKMGNEHMKIDDF